MADGILAQAQHDRFLKAEAEGSEGVGTSAGMSGKKSLKKSHRVDDDDDDDDDFGGGGGSSLTSVKTSKKAHVLSGLAAEGRDKGRGRSSDKDSKANTAASAGGALVESSAVARPLTTSTEAQAALVLRRDVLGFIEACVKAAIVIQVLS